MLRFILRCILFVAPLSLLFAFPAAIFLLAREHYSIERVVQLQLVDPEIVVGKAFIDSDNGGRIHKKLLVEAKKPEIIALGSSRTLQFRKEFFEKPERFINAAFSIANVEQLEDFVRTLPETNKVRMILLGLDQRVFNPGFAPPVTEFSTGPVQRFADFFSFEWRVIYYDYLRGRFTFTQVRERNRQSDFIGLTALVYGDGYRGDGSYRYGRDLGGADHVQFLSGTISDSIESLREDRSAIGYGTEIAARALESLDRLLFVAKERNIAVVGFIPSYAPALYEEMLSVDDAHRELVFELPRAIRRVFSKYRFNVYDFTDARFLGGSYTEFVNDTHATDKQNLRMLLYMAEREPQLSAYVRKDARHYLQEESGDFFPLDMSNKE